MKSFKKIFTRTLSLYKFALALSVTCFYDGKAQFLITAPNYTYTQDFGTTPISGATNITSGTANLLGWSYDGSFAGEQIITAAPPTNTGGGYAYRLGASQDRKIGARASGGTGAIQFGVLFRNTSGQTIKSFSVSYTGYQVSLGGNTNTDVNELTYDYIISTATIPVTASGGTQVPSLNFSQTQFAASTNNATQGVGYPSTVGSGENSGCISLAASIPNNSYLLLRWTDANDPQNDPHLAIDNVMVVFFTNQTVSNNIACSLLPVDLLDFYATKKGSENAIAWKVAQEKEISYYIVEKSNNGIDFTQLSTQLPVTTVNSFINYSINDTDPYDDITYYRLATKEKNGTINYFNIISVEGNSTEWSYDHYFSEDDLIIQFKNAVPEYTHITLYDMAGKLLMDEAVNNYQMKLNLSGFGSGIYFVKITTPYKTENFKIALSKNN